MLSTITLNTFLSKFISDQKNHKIEKKNKDIFKIKIFKLTDTFRDLDYTFREKLFLFGTFLLFISTLNI
jgi:hypothetical protein